MLQTMKRPVSRMACLKRPARRTEKSARTRLLLPGRRLSVPTRRSTGLRSRRMLQRILRMLPRMIRMK